MKKPTAVSFFCGGGGIDLGFIDAGFEIKAAWDWDNYAVQSYHDNIGDHVDQQDIREMTYDDIPKADVWLFGFPCKDISIAKPNGKGLEGEESRMFYQVMRLLEETRELNPDNLPKMIMAENVKKLKPLLPIIEYEYKKQGYIMQERLFNSMFWNVPQSRERYFVAGIHEDLPQTFRFPEEQKEFVPRLSSVIEKEVDEKYFMPDDISEEIIRQALEDLDELGEVHATLTPARVNRRQQGRRARPNEEPMFTLTAQDRHGIIVLGRLNMKGFDIVRRVYSVDGVRPTLTACEGGHRQPKIFDPYEYRVRKLTPREFARCQGFPDSYKIVVSDSQAYKIFGNAVTVPKAKGTALKIKEYLGGLE